jgi:hypothetical protein
MRYIRTSRNVGPGWEGLPGTNALAHVVSKSVTKKKKSFIISTAGVIKTHWAFLVQRGREKAKMIFTGWNIIAI